jgi:hypothetical protein
VSFEDHYKRLWHEEQDAGKALRADLAKAQARCAELEAVCCDLDEAIHSEPTMSGHLRGLHISPVRGEPALRRLKLLLSAVPSPALAAVRLAQRLAKMVTPPKERPADLGLNRREKLALEVEAALTEAFGSRE